ncbi:primosomal replication protein [Shewanella cyperi]|uniref:primosomal replication protein n=1 Tax=Shewanella cyperi TaxID=2814292 RepID=UPI001A93BA98|nr:primosomal replication protein [Shewanella cyperi]QSX42037.1 primosomal replication protein [Shewanella cyperi]
MNRAQLIDKLKEQLAQLEQEVLRHDAALAPQQRKLIQDVERFNDGLFIQSGAQLAPCIGQIAKDIKQLEQRLTLGLSAATIVASCERIQDRFTAVKRALTTTGINLKSATQARQSARNRSHQRQKQAHNSSGFDWIAAGVMQNSHQLYEELNKHLNWARKIESKIAQLETGLDNCHSADKIKLQNEILLMHRRLGKCRQAISYIEDRIQAFERPYQSQNR